MFTGLKTLRRSFFSALRSDGGLSLGLVCNMAGADEINGDSPGRNRAGDADGAGTHSLHGRRAGAARRHCTAAANTAARTSAR